MTQRRTQVVPDDARGLNSRPCAFGDFRSISQKRNSAERQAGIGVGLPLGAVVVSLLILLIHVNAPVASAQVSEPPTTQSASVEDEKIAMSQKESSNSDSFDAWGQLFLAMAIVVGLILALGWLVKRLGGGKTLRGPGTLKLIARANLSSKHQMFLVRMGRRLVLLGAGPQGLSTLSEITDAGEVDELLQAAGLKERKTEGGEA